MENIKTEKDFLLDMQTFSWYDLLHDVDQQSEVSCLTRTKWLETLNT